MKTAIIVLGLILYFLSTDAVLGQEHGYKTDSLKSLQQNGWVWESSPKIDDFSDEQGKIVYKITLTDFGKVEAIEVVECTVSAETEKLYREGTSKLAFKRVRNATEIQKSTGTVTYIIKNR